MPKTLITGGAGFIGLHLGRTLLARGHDVAILDDFSRGVEDRELTHFRHQPGVTFLQRNLITDELSDIGDDYDYIVHLAALLGVDNVRHRPFEVLTLNYAMLQATLAVASRQRSLTRFLFASTSEVYAGTLQHFGMQIPTPELTPLTIPDLSEPRSSYMLSKVYGEALCRYSGLPFTIIRVHNAYGPRMGLSHVIPQLLEKAYAALPGHSLEVFSAEHRRTFCYITDVTEFIARILATPECCRETLNVGTEEPEIAMGELGHLVLQTVGRASDITPLPASPGSPPRRAPDMSRAVSLTGYRSQVGLADGLRMTYEWYLHNAFQGDRLSAV